MSCSPPRDDLVRLDDLVGAELVDGRFPPSTVGRKEFHPKLPSTVDFAFAVDQWWTSHATKLAVLSGS